MDLKLKGLLHEIVSKYELQVQPCTTGKKKEKRMDNSERNLGMVKHLWKHSCHGKRRRYFKVFKILLYN
jgi:hypothetical protein